jgi:hypothetical protein
MSPEAFVQALTQTALAPLVTWTQADLEALLVTCERHGLDPLGRDVYMVREGDPLTDQAVVVVGVNGWSRILNSHPSFAGMQFRESNELTDGLPAWVECTLHRWDRRVPTRVREYLVEVRGTSLAWLTHPRRGRSSMNIPNLAPSNGVIHFVGVCIWPRGKGPAVCGRLQPDCAWLSCCGLPI